MEIMKLKQLVANCRNFWKHWDLRLMVLICLVLQLILIFLGNRRKFSRKLPIRFLVWCAYISADSIAGFTLGILSSKIGEMKKQSKSLDANIELNAFWAPPLLLLLGGPDTITAYSLEDNELWLRHLLSFSVQTAVTLYVYAMVFSVSTKSILAFLMILAGIVKCGERVWVLFLASSKKFRESMLNPPDSYPSYVLFMEKYSLKKAEGYHVTLDGIARPPTDLSTHGNQSITDAEELVQADRMLGIFKRLFVDLLLSNNDKVLSSSIFRNRSWESAFKMVEIELAFVYDLIFTKAQILYTQWGFCRRAFTLSVTCVVLAVFSSSAERGRHEVVDLVITFVLFSAIILMEIYSLLLLLSSDWINVWLSKQDGNLRFRRTISYLQQYKQRCKHRRWSNSMGQFNVLSFCVDEKPLPCCGLFKKLHVDEKLNMFWYMHREMVPVALKRLLFQKIEAKMETNSHFNFDHKLLVLQALRGYNLSHQFSGDELEFDKCILIWHVATEIYFHSMETLLQQRSTPLDPDGHEKANMSKLLSRYMIHLLVSYPFMLPVGTGELRLRDTFAEGKKFFKGEQSTLSQNNNDNALRRACEKLLKVNTEIPPEKVIGARNKSALFDGCRLASELLSVKDPKKLHKQWDMMCDVWVGLLLCAAATKQCRGRDHAQQLRRGGELVSHVWLLLAHFGLTDHFEKTEDHILAAM